MDCCVCLVGSLLKRTSFKHWIDVSQRGREQRALNNREPQTSSKSGWPGLTRALTEADRRSEDGRPRLVSKTELVAESGVILVGTPTRGFYPPHPGTLLLHLGRTAPLHGSMREAAPAQSTGGASQRMCKASAALPTLGGGAGRRCCFLDRTRRLVRLRRERGASTNGNIFRITEDPWTAPLGSFCRASAHRECPVFLFSSLCCWYVVSPQEERHLLGLKPEILNLRLSNG